MIRPNFLFTMKTKNARMGSGCGNYVRVASIIKADTPIFFFRSYSHRVLLSFMIYIKMKMNLNLYMLYKHKLVKIV